MKVLLDYPFEDEDLLRLKKEGIAYCQVPFEDGKSLHDFVRTLSCAELESIDVLIGEAENVDKTLLSLLPNLRWIHNCSAGIEKQKGVNWNLLEQHDIVLTASKIHAKAVSELALANILALLKKLPIFHERRKQKLYQTDDMPIPDMLYDKTVVIIGTGHIGAEIGRKLKCAFQAEVIGISASGRALPYFDNIYPFTTLDSHIGKADVIVLACPYTSKTHHLIDERLISLMKNTAILINVARGKVINQEHLISALTNGNLSAAALDVFEQEPLPPDDPIWSLKNVIITPHIAGDFNGLGSAIIDSFFKNLTGYILMEITAMPDYANEKRY